MKIKTNIKKANQSNKELKDFIPKDIIKIVKERGFYLHYWISFEDLRDSMEEYYRHNALNISSIFILLIFSLFLSYYSQLILFSKFIILLFIIIIILSFTSIILTGIKRSNFFLKNSKILITDRYIIMLGKIIPHKELKENKKKIDHISNIFHKRLFKKEKNKSNIEYKLNNKVYIPIAYKIPIFIFYIFLYLWKVFIKRTLNRRLNKAEIINYLYNELNNNINEAVVLIDNINKNKNNSKKFDKLGELLDKIMNNSSILRQELTESKYRDIFNISLLNKWIISKVAKPVNHILTSLKYDLDEILSLLQEKEKQINETNDITKKKVLNTSKKTLRKQKDQLLKNIKLIDIFG